MEPFLCFYLISGAGILLVITWFCIKKYKSYQHISFKPLQETDLPLYFKWINLPHVSSNWWEKFDNYETFCQKNYPSQLAANHTFPFIVYLNKKPISYVQYYLAEKADDGWWAKNGEPSPGTIGMDIFIGEAEYLGKGYGTLILKKLIKKLFKQHEIKKIIIDPNHKNIPAICCYKKVGFKEIKEIETPYGRALLMEMKNEKKGLKFWKNGMWREKSCKIYIIKSPF